ncbi:MAG TPA: glycosyltransferase family 39 protein, partial [Terriglobales bacterium]
MSPESPSVASPEASARAKREHRAEAASSERQRSKIVFGIVFLLSALLMSYWMNRGWIPGDDGTLAQGALRVMQGQLPHRDFVENYTGGLDYYHALAFRLLGVNLTALRMAVFVVFLGWVPAVFSVVRRLAGPIAAGLITLLCVTWSLPTYPAAMPSWYNLFLATFGTVAILRFTETGKQRWLFVAGLAGGVSFLVKVTALYYVAAVMLFLIYREQRRGERGSGGAAGYRAFVIAGLSAFAVAVCLLIRGNVTLFTVTEIALPSVAAAMALVLGNLRSAGEADGSRLRRLLGEAWPFAAGALVPIAVFLVPYFASSSVGRFFSGVFVAGAGRA